jgi:hypothetical protein
VNGVLVTKPIRTLDGIVHVPSPVILVHVTERCVDTSLGGNGVGSGWEELRNTSSVETSLGKTESSSKTSSTRSNDDSIVFVILNTSAGSSIVAL